MSRLLKALSKSNEVLRILIEEEGLTDSEFLLPLDDRVLARWIVQQWKRGPQSPQNMSPESSAREAVPNVPDSDSHARCRELFGADFFGMSEVVSSYGYGFSAKESEERKSVRILGHDGATLLSEERSWEAIRRCRDEAPGQFVLCAGVPHSVCDVHAKHADVFYPDLRKNPWFGETEQHEWSKRVMRDSWLVLAKDVIPDSWDMSSVDQEQWLPTKHPCRRFALPEHIAYGSVLCAKATQGRMRLYCGERWGRTLQRTARGFLVDVGFRPEGLDVGHWDGGAGWDHGVPSLWTS